MLGSVIPAYIPGESAYSWVSQYFVQSAYSDRNRVCDRLFQHPAIRLHPSLPGHIEATAQAAGVDPQYLLHHGTGFPLYALTLRDKLQVDTLASAMLGEGQGLMALSGQAASKLAFGGVCLKWCPACLREDEQDVGCGYWHTAHQLYGVTACTKHALRLQTLAASAGGIDRQLLLPDPEMPCEPSRPSEQEINLSTYITALHRYLCVQSPTESLAELYLRWLGQQGYLTARGHLRSQPLLQAMTEFWQGLFADITPIVPPALANYRYVSGLVHGDRSHHYLKHVMLMAFVSRSPAEFFSIEVQQVLPVPPARDAQAVERAVLRWLAEPLSMRQVARQTGYSVGYIKQLALRHNHPVEHRAQRITAAVARGIWRQAFMGVSRQQIAHCHGVSVGAVEAIIQSHQGLSDWRRHLGSVRKLREHRDTLTTYLTQHVDASRGGIEQACRTAFSWLYRHDRSWLYQQLPAPKQSVYHPSVDWVRRDRALVAQLEQLDGEARSLSALERALGRPDWLRKYKARLPLSYALAVRLVAAYAAQHPKP
ncbi:MULTISPECIES: TnsD family Tn7-like transposition protein [Aeromonas]|uniref:TnsD family Tn7-like transposition protein n=1 Tax=Aeromonas TaxID=642 RepID=UPI00259F28F3|nr:TnsD family Tn7-like transposition protein [Aeromonas rivipollensis]MDM5123068.1 TnsD family transposase [Aeromonas rivipollensis]